MEAEKSEAQKTSAQSVQNPNSSSKFVFANPAKKLGKFTTQALVEAKQFLSQDVPLPSAEKLVDNLRKRRITDSNEKTITEIRQIVERSNEVLMRAKTPFMLTLFPDEIIVDRSKITIIKRNFFWSADMVSIRIEDVLNVTTSVGPLFGSVNFASRVMNSIDHFQIGPFWRETAIDIKLISQGYIIARNNNLDCDHLSVEELVATLSELGHDSST